MSIAIPFETWFPNTGTRGSLESFLGYDHGVVFFFIVNIVNLVYNYKS
jgi:hypothetical protein